ncbi:unnamed protein product [Orchesella dallaii]|uniref:Uncharacterized protein n=1 Tax=Orchesella dallaii TaxID=48710 RepID=A0ABP1RC10_9HEXA
MNKEYAKFDQPRAEYNPPTTEPGHFRNLPDVLIPEEYEDVAGDPIERDVHDLFHNTATPPPTPPELEPGRAGCHFFQDKVHYMAPCYQDENFQRILACRMIISNMLTYIPSIVMGICLVSCSFDTDMCPINFVLVFSYVVNAIGQDSSEEEAGNGTLSNKELDRRILEKSSHSPPYIALLMILFRFILFIEKNEDFEF